MGTGEEPPPVRRENGGRRRRWSDNDDGDDYDDEDFVAEEEEEEEEEELPASSAGEDGEDSDAEYRGEDDEEEEEEEETPRPKRPGKGGARGRKGKRDPATARAKRRRYDVDDDYEEEPSDDEDPNEEDEVEEYDEDEETPRPVKVGTWGRKGKADPATARARRRRYDMDEDYEEEPDEDEELEPELEPDHDEDAEEYHEEIEEEKEEEEEEETPSQPKSTAKCARRGQNVELARSNRRKYEDEDIDFEPELDGDEEEEVDEDIDFDPEVDDEDEFEDEEEEEFSAARIARKVRVRTPAKRKSVSKRRSLKKKSSKGSKASKRKKGSAKARKPAPVRRVRKRFVVGDSDEDSEDDDDFIVDDPMEVNRHPRKKARTGSSKRTELEHPSVEEEEAWPNVESETSEFEFVTSDDEPDDAGTVVEDSSTRKRRKKKMFMSDSSSDSEFVLSDKELENLGPVELPKPPPVLTAPVRKSLIITRHGEDKGKEKEGPEEAGKPICGICLSEEQRATVQGVLNCCSHYFCFACIMEWSRVESRCPLCKQRFITITKSSKADLGLGLRKAVIKVEERDQVYQPTEEEIRRWLDPYENVVCIECNQGGDDSLMLLCDICDSSAHTYCVGLGREVPEGNWYCGGCRLNDEGPSHARMPHTVGYERQSYRNHVDISSVGFGMAPQNGTYDRSSSINRHRSFQGIDLNLSPREAPGETHLAESQASTDSVSTPSGRRATVSGRRQIHRYIRILLSQPRQVTTTRQDMLPTFVPRNGAEPRTELNRRSFRSPSEGTTAQIPDGIQNQNDGLAFAPSMPLDGDDFHHMEGVKSNLRNMQ